MARPPMAPELRARILALAEQDPGASVRALAERVGTSKDSVWRVLRAAAAPVRAAVAGPAGAAGHPGTPDAAQALSGARPSDVDGYPNLTRRTVRGDGGGYVADVRATRTVVLCGRAVEMDESGRLFCDGCAAWLPVGEATARGSVHRAVPGVSFRTSGLLPLSDADERAWSTPRPVFW